jgi:membrane protein YqaA with SNARE-associated domain
MRFLKLIVLAATFVGALWLAIFVQGHPVLQSTLLSGGYVGIFLFSFINGFNVLVPVVTATFVPALSGAGLDPYILVAFISLGMTLADSVAFFLARAGRVHLSRIEGRVMRTLFAVEEREHWLPLVILAFWSIVVPVPSELVLIPLGLLGYSARQVLPIVLVGNIIFNSAVAFWAFSVLTMIGS